MEVSQDKTNYKDKFRWSPDRDLASKYNIFFKNTEFNLDRIKLDPVLNH